jgi:hypothetical protein
LADESLKNTPTSGRDAQSPCRPFESGGSGNTQTYAEYARIGLDPNNNDPYRGVIDEMANRSMEIIADLDKCLEKYDKDYGEMAVDSDKRSSQNKLIDEVPDLYAKVLSISKSRQTIRTEEAESDAIIISRNKSKLNGKSSCTTRNADKVETVSKNDMVSPYFNRTFKRPIYTPIRSKCIFNERYSIRIFIFFLKIYNFRNFQVIKAL